MQKDFHFECIGVLALAAGFAKGDAYRIAYCSQYVDHATESEPIRVGNLIFEPVRTAHYGLESYDWSVQKRVYIPFHFLPAKPLRSQEDTFLTAPDSEFCDLLWQHAVNESDADFRLYRMGVALHMIADSWAHKTFSGRRNKENDVEAISVKIDGKWKKPILENIYLDVLPQVGHTEAGTYPDQPGKEWKCKRPGAPEYGKPVKNADNFFKAAKVLYQKLVKYTTSQNMAAVLPFAGIEARLKELFALTEECSKKRAKVWLKLFSDLMNENDWGYTRLKWRNAALNPPKKEMIDWDSWHPNDFSKYRFPYQEGFYDSDWVKFHRAALKQRHLVLEHLL